MVLGLSLPNDLYVIVPWLLLVYLGYNGLREAIQELTWLSRDVH